MQNIYSVVDLGSVGLSIEQIKSYAASQNIANANSPGYTAKSVNTGLLLRNLDMTDISSLQQQLQKKADYLQEQPGKKIALDDESLNLSSAELRYQVISQIVQKQFGMMDLVFGGKK